MGRFVVTRTLDPPVPPDVALAQMEALRVVETRPRRGGCAARCSCDSGARGCAGRARGRRRCAPAPWRTCAATCAGSAGRGCRRRGRPSSTSRSTRCLLSRSSASVTRGRGVGEGERGRGEPRADLAEERAQHLDERPRERDVPEAAFVGERWAARRRCAEHLVGGRLGDVASVVGDVEPSFDGSSPVAAGDGHGRRDAALRATPR